jgi:hypothetical protein
VAGCPGGGASCRWDAPLSTRGTSVGLITRLGGHWVRLGHQLTIHEGALTLQLSYRSGDIDLDCDPVDRDYRSLEKDFEYKKAADN